MASRPQKRASPHEEDEPPLPCAKRPRTSGAAADESFISDAGSSADAIASAMPSLDSSNITSATTRLPTIEEQARSGLRRSIALALQHVGFDSTSEAALERFTEMSEEYLVSFIEEVRLFSLASRRAQPIPTDYEVSLKRFNLGTSLLRPHLKNPVSRRKLNPTHETFADIFEDDDATSKELPLLGEELSGRPEKEAKSYIPKSFPDFPSIHTYRATPQDVDEVTVHGSGLKWSDGTLIVTNDSTTMPEDLYLGGPGGSGPPRDDPRRIREVAARESKQAEEALRGVVRASKINTLKEARLAAQRNVHSRLRYDIWETAMRDMLEDVTSGGGLASKGGRAANVVLLSGAGGGGGATAGAARGEIADHSMIVNAQKSFQRQEVSRAGKRAAAEVAAAK